MNNIKILKFDGIDVSEGIDINKTNKSKECDICHCCCCYLNKGFKFQPHACKTFHALY